MYSTIIGSPSFNTLYKPFAKIITAFYPDAFSYNV